jgi:MYXO-CTERM domain-containing protein
MKQALTTSPLATSPLATSPFATRTLATLPFLLAAATLSTSARAESLVRHPYLQKTTPTSTVLVWTTDTPAPSLVEYGSSPDALSQTVALPDSVTEHEVELTGLAPGKRYYYRVGSPDNPLAGGDAEHHFDTAPVTGSRTKLRAWIVGDSGTGQSPQRAVRDAMLTFAGAYRPQLFLHMGDMAYNTGTTTEFTDRFFAPYAPILQNTVCYPTMGNHEGATSDSGTQTGPYYSAYVLPKAGEAGGLPSGTEAYYSFDWANVHFIVLDSHDSPRSPGGAMLTWMKADLAATAQDWIVAYWHHPPYSKGTHDSDTEPQLVEMRQNALPILEAGGVDLVLAGHSHIYERSFLVDGAYDTPTTAAGHVKDPGNGAPLGDGPYQKPVGNAGHEGAVHVVAGHGGAQLGHKGKHPLMHVTETQLGSCLLDVHDHRLSLVNVRADGSLTDRFTMIKGTGIVVASPDGGEHLERGAAHEIRWVTTGDIPAVKIEVSTDDGATFTPLVESAPNTGTYPWTVPSVVTAAALVRVSSASDPAIFDESNAGFRIGQGASSIVIPYGSEWRYSDQGEDPGPTWPSPAFDDGDWPAGPAQLGYGDGDEGTVLFNAEPNHPSVYFRRRFTLDAAISAAELQVVHDDGVAVWINGDLVFSRHMDGGTDHAALASGPSEDNETSRIAVPLAPDPFVTGENTVAVMVKQSTDVSSDLSFDLALRVTYPPAQGAGGSGPTGGTGAGGAASGGSGGQDGGGLESGDCGCHTGPADGSPAALLFAAVLGLLRRRRRRQRRTATADGDGDG